MNCDSYMRFELGELSEQDFQNHVLNCEQCRDRITEDEKLFMLADSLKQPVNELEIWSKIEENLVQEKQNSGLKHFQLKEYRTIFLRVAAVLLIGLSSGLYFLIQDQDLPESGIIESQVLEEVKAQEQEYIKAIENLERLSSTKLTTFDLNLQLLYRDKIETIDRQIIACKEALEQNPANAHIRRYLLMALQDKHTTLSEIMSVKPSETQS